MYNTAWAAALILIYFSTTVNAMAADPKPLPTLEVGTYADLAPRPNPENLILQAIPSLAAILLSVENKKGSSLTQSEVEALRDHMNVIAVPPDAAHEADVNRGYKDIDPIRAWEEWQLLRTQLK